MTGTEIIIKGEIHTSRSDLNEEREILVEGVDHLVIEGPEEDELQIGIFEQWYGFVLFVFYYLFHKPLYANHTILFDIAKSQNARIHRTRKSDMSILHNSKIYVRIVAVILFTLFLVLSILFGWLGKTAEGAMLLLISSLAPLLLMRVHESRRRDVGRDKQIAELIGNVAEEGGRIVAIMGNTHAKNVPKYLPEDLPEPKEIPPNDGLWSINTAKELVYPGFVFFSVLYVFYTVFIYLIQLPSTVLT